MEPVTLGVIADWCGAAVSGPERDILIRDISTDSRTVQPGELFIPLVGETFDGHTFLETAADRGAAAVLSSRRELVWQKNIPILYVDDTLSAYQAIAAGYRRTLTAKVVGITGSVGKTTTKEMTAAILAQRYRTASTVGNHNNLVGLPQTVLAAPKDCQALVLEMGMNHFGEISRMTAVARPDIAVINNIGMMHIEFLGSRAGILKAKLEILEGETEQGVAVFNGDEPLLWNCRAIVRQRLVYFGISNEQCDVRGTDIQPLDGGIRFVCHAHGQTFPVELPVEGEHNVCNALAAIAATMELGATPEEIQRALRQFENVGMRQKIYTKNGFQIIEDCYNAGPQSMEAALKLLGERPCEGRRIAVLGSMLELGHRANAEHYRIGRLAAKHADLLLAYGESAREYVTGALTGGMPPRDTLYFDTPEATANALSIRARKGDTILFKGSRGMRMEQIIELFLAEN